MADQVLPAIPTFDRNAGLLLQLTRGFRIATDIRKLFLGGLALLLLAAGQMASAWLPFAPEPSVSKNPETSLVDHILEGWLGQSASPRSILGHLVEPAPQQLWRLGTHWGVLLLPLRSVIEPAILLIQPGLTWSQAGWGVTRLLWALSVWALFGGALARMAAVQFATNGSSSVWTALRFSATKFISLICSPLLPLTGVGLLAALCALGGTLGRISGAGPMIVASAWGLALVLAFLMTLMLLATAAGWPLMVSAICTEGSDAFDGFSRSYSFLFSRPWQYAGYVLFALVYGSLGLVFLSIVATLIVHLAAWGVGLGMGGEAVRQLHVTAPAAVGEAMAAASQLTPTTASHIVGGWLFVLSTLLAGYVVSYFWTASTIIYFLLRKSDDATHLEEVWLPEIEEVDDLLPLAGVAASEQRPVIERPVRPPAAEPAAGTAPTAAPATDGTNPAA